MNQNTTKLFLFISLAFLGLTTNAVASNIKINAGVLPVIWYSSTDIYDKDSISIFGGIQNHSDIDFSGTAVVYVDGNENSKSPFISKSDSLVEINSHWIASLGSHDIQIKVSDVKTSSNIATGTFGIDSLLSAESNKVSLSVGQHITIEDIKTKAVDAAVNTVQAIDKITNNLADKIESLKKPEIGSDAGLINSSNITNLTGIATAVKSIGKVLGAETKYQPTSTKNTLLNSKIGTTIYNKVLDFLSLIVRNWKISIFVIVALILIFRLLI
jgi:hypothetical protein